MPNFTDLSGELRNKIYRNLFVFDEAIDLTTGVIVREPLMGQRTVEEDGKTYWFDYRPKDFTDPKHKYRNPASAQIFRASKQLYEEGASIRYGENRFYVDDVDDLKRIGASGKRHLALIKNLVVRCSSKQDFQIRTPSPLTSFSNLQNLTFLTGFREYHNPHDLYGISTKKPDEGSKVSMSHPGLPDKFPSLSRLFLCSTITDRNVAVYFEVWRSLQRDELTIWEPAGADCYRVLPIPPGSPPESSLIQREYDLIFEEFFEPS